MTPQWYMSLSKVPTIVYLTHEGFQQEPVHKNCSHLQINGVCFFAVNDCPNSSVNNFKEQDQLQYMLERPSPDAS